MGALDVALYRSEDPRFEQLATHLLRRLADPQLGHSDGTDRYQFLSALSGLVQSRVALLPGCATRPNYWRRACALMHGGWLLDEFERLGVPSDLNGFVNWVERTRGVSSVYADAVGARTEPMLHAGIVTDWTLRDEVAGRLELLRGRHEKQRRRTSWSDATHEAWRRVREAVSTQVFGFPGPLEGDRRPRRCIPDGVVEALHAACADRPDISRLRILAAFSQGAKPGATELETAREAVTEIGRKAVGLPEINELNFASFVAVAHRDLALGDEVADVLIRLSGQATEREIVHQIVRLMVQTAAVNEERESWSMWLEGRLQSIAKALPGPPSPALGAFLESLRGMQLVLPSEEWLHLRARAVALSGAA